jgi:hypothetical protein
MLLHEEEQSKLPVATAGSVQKAEPAKAGAEKAN